MRVISWNLNGRRRDLEAQVAALAARAPDVVALQEVTPGTVAELRRALARAGLPHAVDSFTLAPPSFEAIGPRRYGQLTASRCEVAPEAPGRFVLPWPERVLTVRVRTPSGEVEVHNTHVPPGSSNGWVKIDQLVGLFDGLARESAIPRILCGDFNAPQEELPTGEVVTWAKRRGSAGWRVARMVRGGPGAAWDAGERRIMTDLATWALPDVFRQLHGYAVQEASWLLRRGDTVRGRRFDHVFASPTLVPQRCVYLHELRERGLSDHSPVEVDFGWPTCAG
ncbi:endonuclease/exonuclease/phosphatase family protein [Roseisolibacter sp. H3M3-2]|uniref:endonuclease/exonuclease/phosphatase family protein n=1 Tax=Roseisolibacter sp. H3M3-2 TaxID=3031323 RepID=UPI0023DBBA77|nr:endonuclease/exonuclease/phosphatase family protein [Roseisolibacter sp. H3M3-2]MDF1503849.1 endonuclease/exonuclease/phosphatase family protein [Roseisolibacter sp. H3M3-2]